MEIELNAKAERQLGKLEKRPAVHTQIEDALDRLALNPYLGKMLEGEFTGVRSYRAGDWRVLYVVEVHRLTVFVISIADRKEAYR